MTGNSSFNKRAEITSFKQGHVGLDKNKIGPPFTPHYLIYYWFSNTLLKFHVGSGSLFFSVLN